MTAAFMQPLPTPIGAGTTKLPTSIQFDPVMLAPPGPSLHGSLGLPPQHLREVHWPALVEECATRIRAALAQPTRTHRAGAIRRIGLLGALIYERLPHGQYRLYEWRPGEVDPDQDGGHHVGLPWLRPVPDGKVVIDGAPYQALWLTCYADGLRQALELQWPEHPQIDPYVDWVMLRLEQKLWTESTQQRVRQNVARALGLNGWILQRARRWLAHGDGSPIRIADYNTVLWRRQHWARLQAESPQWLPLLAQLWRHLPTEGEPLAHLRALLLNNGVSPAMWRLLHREGTGWIWPLRNYYTKDSWHSGRAALELVLKAQKFGTRRLVPVWMLQALMNLDGNPNRPRTSYLKKLEDPIDAPMAVRLGQWAADMALSGDEPGLQQLQGQCYLLLDWATAHPRYVTSRAMRQVTLPALWRKAEQWHQRQLAKARQRKPWRAPFDLTAVEHDELQLVWLGSAVDILEEAFAMRHCADSYVEPCARGSYVLLSVRRKDTGKRLATVGVKPAGRGPELHQMAGFANALVPPHIAAFARQAVACLKINQPEPTMPKSSKPRTYVHLTAVWGNDDAESTIKVSRRRWQQIQDGEPYDTTAWSLYEGVRSHASWSFNDGKLTISLGDGFEIDLTTKRLYVEEVTTEPGPKK
ncbi:MAG: PcfJ domain-containing protein [Burkholderiales bacterium]|uniref:PcfJ domain-containing protein n=1 Tax=Ottowia sp. TaxID=1898956 RepID=UPI001AD4A175|nr:PcfJ domain-containing protein [Ottowia sp.]MBN9407476.1 PcfJ domain-containing protein [Burkholderiales bacterium]